MKIKVNQRKMLISLLTTKYGMNKLHNGRKLNRLSTKQLEKKIETIERSYNKQVSKYVGFLDSFFDNPLMQLDKLTIIKS